MDQIFTTMVAEVGRLIQKTDATYATKIKEAINRHYELLSRKYMWRSLIEFDEAITFTSGAEFISLPKRCEKVLVITDRTNDVVLVPSNVQILMRNHLDTITDQSNAVRYTVAGEYGSKATLTAAAQVQVVSSSASDTSINVRIRGVDANGEELTELINSNGTTAVDSANTYKSGSLLRVVSKDAVSIGIITIREKTANTELATIAPWEYVPKYLRLRLHKVPNATITNYLTYKRRHVPLVNNEDIIEIPCLSALKMFAYADMLEEQRQFQKASVKRAEAEAEIQALLVSEHQGDNIEQSQPEIHELAIDSQITE